MCVRRVTIPFNKPYRMRTCLQRYVGIVTTVRSAMGSWKISGREKGVRRDKGVEMGPRQRTAEGVCRSGVWTEDEVNGASRCACRFNQADAAGERVLFRRTRGILTASALWNILTLTLVPTSSPFGTRKQLSSVKRDV